MWFLRRMLRVSWTEKRTNLEILNTASSTRKLMSNIKRRQAEFLGHVMRKGKLEHLLTTGKIEGKRSRGRQIIKIQDGVAAWLGRSTAAMFVDARDRKKWKVMIAYACNRHDNWWWWSTFIRYPWFVIIICRSCAKPPTFLRPVWKYSTMLTELLTPAAGDDSTPTEESGKHAKFLTNVTRWGALVAAKLTDLSNSGIFF